MELVLWSLVVVESAVALASCLWSCLLACLVCCAVLCGAFLSLSVVLVQAEETQSINQEARGLGAWNRPWQAAEQTKQNQKKSLHTLH